VLAALAGCGEAGDSGGASPKDGPLHAEAQEDERSAPAALRALVARNLGPLAEAMTQIAVEVRAPGDDAPTTLLAAVPDRIRRMTPDGRTAIWTPDGAWVWSTGAAAEPADETTRAELAAWLTALDLMTLAPFRRAVSVRRSSPDTLEVELDGEARSLRYRASDDTILELRRGDLSIRILEHHDSGAARIPTRIASEALGERTLRFLGTGVGFDPTAFEPPSATKPPSRSEIVVGGPSSASGPRAEVLPAVSWWVVEDPGSWTERLARIRSAGRMLGAAGYGNGGDPMLVREDGAAWLVVPFRSASASPKPVVPGTGEKIIDRTGERILVVEPEPGPAAARVEGGNVKLEAHASELGLGAPRWTAVSWNLIDRDPANDPGCLDRAPLRVMHGLGR
jgi:hypothetical protein